MSTMKHVVDSAGDLTTMQGKAPESAVVLDDTLAAKMTGLQVEAPAAPAGEVADLLQRLTAGTSEEERAAAATELAALVKADGISTLQGNGLLEQLTAAVDDKASAAAREGALLALAALAEAVPTAAEPYLVALLPQILERFSDKVAGVRTAADKAGRGLMACMSPHALRLVVPVLLDGMEFKRHWQVKVAALALLGSLTKTAPVQLAGCLPEIIPVITDIMGDAKNQVKAAAISGMTEVCSVVGNRDIEPFIPVLVSCIARPTEVAECVHKLGATTFVQTVEAPTLALLVPVLVRGLRERQTAVKRKACVIIDNMSKLVDNPLDAAVFLPKLMPGVEKVSQEVADPECRSVAARAHATLIRVGAEGKALDEKALEESQAKLGLGKGASSAEGAESTQAKLQAAVLAALKDAIQKHTSAKLDSFAMVAVEYVAALCAQQVAIKDFTNATWHKECVGPYLSHFVSAEEAAAVAKSVLARCEEETQEKETVVDDEEGEDLCKCEFSLAYGGKILLNNATLHLKRGQRYGLCGPNGVGKSTLMRAIANGQLDGFPPKEELRTVYVEHDIDASEAETPVVEFIFKDPVLQGASHPEHSLVEEVLASVGFTPELQRAPVASLSGGWKMKLALARAMLMKADIMLLDEPTNHLDVNNVAWLEKYLISLTQVTSMIVSHDSSFLDNVCTGIIHYENLKLRKYRGNLSEFVKVKPEARSYYDLAAAQLKFVLPEPGFLEGVKNKDKAILKMQNVAFTYPGTTRQILSGVTVQCSLASRVACVGANGAGKSTAIKLLTGETEPDSGLVWKHPNMRIAYVAQHAFHHIEQHLDKTPNQYIQWRYAIGEDRENLSKVNRKVTAEEEKAMSQKFVVDGEKRVVDKLLGRRKLKKSYEYEVQWVGMPSDQTSWLTRDKLEEMGFSKMVNEVDIKEAARLGLHTKPLTTAVVQKHLEDLGIEPEFGTHSRMAGLSGGQKVKVVLAAAMWQNPHLLVLDEPTNYLDRESLGALAGAIKNYGGGVIMITHNSEFSKALCPETWMVADGKLTIDGAPAALAASAAKLEWKPEEEMIDAFGNVVKIKQPKKKLSNKEKKKLEKVRKARRDRGEEVTDSEDED